MLEQITGNKKVLAVVMVAAVVAAIWLIMTPSRERQAYLYSQEALIEDILQGYPEDYNGINLYTDPAEGQEPYIFNLYEMPALDTEQYQAGYLNPIPGNEFPAAVTGIGILTIDRIDLRLPVAEGVTEESLRIAVGRVPQTAQIGDIGNAVIAGHRNYTRGQMFNRLDELEVGDIISYQARNGEEMRFVVFEITNIIPDDQIAFVQPTIESIITLYTCTPVRTATYRLLVRAQRVPITEEGAFY